MRGFFHASDLASRGGIVSTLISLLSGSRTADVWAVFSFGTEGGSWANDEIRPYVSLRIGRPGSMSAMAIYRHSLRSDAAGVQCFNCKRGTASASSNESVLPARVDTILLHLATEADAGDRKSANTLRSAAVQSPARSAFSAESEFHRPQRATLRSWPMRARCD
jgi:hypothetical protein